MSLTDDQRRVLMWGLYVWIGPGIVTKDLASTLWFDGKSELQDNAQTLRDQIDMGIPLTRDSWRKVLAMKEIDFSSQVFGAGLSWASVTGLDDVVTLTTLRSIQRLFRSFRASKK